MLYFGAVRDINVVVEVAAVGVVAIGVAVVFAVVDIIV